MSLVELWEDVLGVKGIGTEDDFFRAWRSFSEGNDAGLAHLQEIWY